MDNDAVFKLIADSTYDWESWLAADGSLRWVNPAVTRITGYSVQECMAMENYPNPMVLPADLASFGRFAASSMAKLAGNDLPFRLRRKDGAIIWVAMSWQPMFDQDGEHIGTRTSIRDTTQGMRNDYLERLRPAASRAMHNAALAAASPERVYRIITECAARSLGVARVGVWLFDDGNQNLKCADLFVSNDNSHSSGVSIAVADYSRYFSAISGDQLVIASDAQNDAVTEELTASYLKPLGICSLLDAPIVRAGRTVGVLCHEHTDAVRFWNPAELAFVETLADFLALTLESSERLRLEDQTRELASIIEATPDMVTTVGLDGKPSYLNHAGFMMLAGRDDLALSDFNITDAYSPQAMRFRDDVVLPTALRDGHWSGETSLHTLTGDNIPVWQTLIAHRDGEGNVKYLSSVIRDLREQKRVEAQLRAREQSLQALNAELEQRVVERTRKLEEVNRNLEAFAYSVSHDLKAPLRGIDGYSRLLLEDYRSQLPGEAPQFIDNIRGATERMHQLIDDLLAFSRLGRRELATTHFAVRQVLERILAERQHDIESRGVTIVNQVGDVEINADLDCFLQLLRNLVDNAIKFTRDVAKPLVVITATQDAARTQVSVKDNGCGFDMKYHDRIFAIFQRLHRVEDFPGTGVGLAIVNKAAERMGGRVWARSEPGGGAEFFLELPQ
jgi:PAS domain S-box-containing protein